MSEARSTTNYSDNLFETIQHRGWDNVPFEVSESDRAEYAASANLVISAAQEDETVNDALLLDLNAGVETGPVRSGMFGIGTARNSTDKKVYLHTGFHSREYADTVIPERNQPEFLRTFWEENDQMLRQIEQSTQWVLETLYASELGEAFFPREALRRNVHLRTVRYTDAVDQPVGSEVVSGHSDIGMGSFHIYETHGNWFQAVPYPSDLIEMPDLDTSDVPTIRRGEIKQMRDRMKLIDSEENKATFFLGVNWSKFPTVPERLRGLPACYHAGIRPPVDVEEVSPYAEMVAGNAHDRVSVISFLHPDIKYLHEGIYKPGTVEECRPKYEEESSGA